LHLTGFHAKEEEEDEIVVMVVVGGGEFTLKIIHLKENSNSGKVVWQ
jgi:hypothetical protein